MSKKQPFQPNQVRQLIHSAFQNVEFIQKLPLLTFHKDQMLGCIYVEPDDRISLLAVMSKILKTQITWTKMTM